MPTKKQPPRRKTNETKQQINKTNKSKIRKIEYTLL